MCTLRPDFLTFVLFQWSPAMPQQLTADQVMDALEFQYEELDDRDWDLMDEEDSLNIRKVF